jgi:hypothetical protein
MMLFNMYNSWSDLFVIVCNEQKPQYLGLGGAKVFIRLLVSKSGLDPVFVYTLHSLFIPGTGRKAAGTRLKVQQSHLTHL